MAQTRWASVLAMLALLLLTWTSASHARSLSRPEPGGKQPPLLARAAPPPSTVFRGDGRNPQKVKAAGGFLPHSSSPPRSLKAYSLYNHVLDSIVDVNNKMRDTVYVSTTTAWPTAANFAADRPLGGFVYRIHATPNMVDVQESMLSHNPFPGEREWAAMGGVRWEQIEGWMFLPENYSRADWRKAGAPTLETEMWRFIRNPDYASRFDAEVASPGQPQLVAWFGKGAAWANLNPWKKFKPTKTKSIMDYAVEFMDKHGKPVGWNGRFPLLASHVPHPKAKSTLDVSQTNPSEEESSPEDESLSLAEDDALSSAQDPWPTQDEEDPWATVDEERLVIDMNRDDFSDLARRHLPAKRQPTLAPAKRHSLLKRSSRAPAKHRRSPELGDDPIF
ncbi:putative enterotoxin [Ophiocordyceps australis]|uniref:Putative enterotoxin n=1 Tax=Ophiocordyceps australis TaxID=1399860 RepID=A0A2C5XKS8_9HYPO|nr:putative enterotoxin [Ophiocordyceps australis]